jgi:hypothetical protein
VKLAEVEAEGKMIMSNEKKRAPFAMLRTGGKASNRPKTRNRVDKPGYCTQLWCSLISGKEIRPFSDRFKGPAFEPASISF